VIRLEEVRHGYAERPDVLRGCSLEVAAGEVAAVAGPNGSGKSTLLRVAAGVLAPQGGRVLLDGRLVPAWHRLERAKRLAYVPQSPVLPPEWTVADLVALGDYPHRERPPAPRPLQERLGEVKDLLSLGEVWFRRAGALSGGEAQRVALGRALVQDTPVLVLDEPASHLDLSGQIALFRLLKSLAGRGRAVLLATHDITLSLLFGHRLLILNGDGVLKPFPEAEEAQGLLLERAFGVPFAGMEVEGVTCWYPRINA